MKTLILCGVLFFSTAAFAMSETEEIQNLCVKNSVRPVDAKPSNKDVCECSITATVKLIEKNTKSAPELKLKMAWLKKLYALQLSQKEIDADPYGILEFNFPITEQCLKDPKIK